MKYFVSTGVVDHVLAVEGDSGSFQAGSVTITQYEGVCRHGKYESFWKRVKDAWRTFKGEGRCWEEFFQAEGLDGFISCLEVARMSAFGPKEKIGE